MIKAKFDETVGSIVIPGARLNSQYSFEIFRNSMLDATNLIYGEGENASYSLRTPLMLFNEEFRLGLRFVSGKLHHCTFLLISGPVRARTAEYPEHAELQLEVDFLTKLFSANLHGEYVREFEWRHTWKYSWGEVALFLQPQNSSVITDLSWKEEAGASNA